MSTIPSPMDHHLILLLLLLLLQTLHVSIAQTIDPPPSQNNINTGFTTMTATIFAALLVIFALIAFVSVYFNRCAYGHNTTTGIMTTRPSTIHVVTSDDTTNRHGLDLSVLETFPIMEYSAVKGLHTIKGPLECAVCLSEFGSDESLRLLPGCCHVFHPDCIDKWLKSHITCPVCRADLTQLTLPTINTVNISVSVDANQEPITERHLASAEVTNAFDRFTLRLPDHVRREIEDARRHRRAVSISGYAYDRRESGRSGRLWGIFRSLSLRRRADGDIGEGSFKRVFPVVEDAGAPASSQSSSGSRLEEESQSDAHASEMVVFDRV